MAGRLQEAEAQKEQQEVQRELQEWTAAAQCKAIDALSPEQVHAAASTSMFIFLIHNIFERNEVNILSEPSFKISF